VIHVASFGWGLTALRGQADALGGCAVPTLPHRGSPHMFMPAAISDQKLDAGKGEKAGIS